jgi:hypothetical protein
MLKERGGSERWRERHREAAMDDEGRQRATLTSVRAHEAVAWGTQEFFGGEENRHVRACIYTAQIISKSSR